MSTIDQAKNRKSSPDKEPLSHTANLEGATPITTDDLAATNTGD